MSGGNTKYATGGVAVTIGGQATVELPPRVFRGRVLGLLFELDKCFLLPSALAGMHGLKAFYDKHPGLEVLVVGHTDTSGTPEHNAVLSVDRAEAVAAFLRDDVAAWLTWFGKGKPAAKRWGVREEQHMLAGLTDGGQPWYTGRVDGRDGPATRAAVRRFLEAKNLAAADQLGDAGRHALVEAYMGQDDTTLPAGTTLLVHGCGEFHPDPEAASSDDNRRVEIFLFEGPIDPPPRSPCAAPGCAEHAKWLANVVETVDVREEGWIDVRIALFDRAGKPLGGAPFEVVIDGRTVRGQADGGGIALLEHVSTASECVARWSGPDWQAPADGPEFEFARDVKLELGADGPEAAGQRLHNLGYCCGSSVSDGVRRFQEDFDLPVNGNAADGEFDKKLREMHDGCAPARGEPERKFPPSLICEE